MIEGGAPSSPRKGPAEPRRLKRAPKPSLFVVSAQLPYPDVAETHRVAMVLQSKRTFGGVRVVVVG